MKTKQLTLLSFFFEDMRVIEKMFKGKKEELNSIDIDAPEKNGLKNYPHLTDVDTWVNTRISSREFTPEGDEIRREYRLKNFYWSDKPSIKKDLELVYMRKYRLED